MEIEHRYVTKFFTDEGIPGVKINSRLWSHYGEKVLSRTQVYFWINEVKRGRTYLNTIANPGREPDEGIGTVIAGKPDADPHLSARRLAKSLRIAASTVGRSSAEVLGMKCRHFGWVPHASTAAQQVVRVQLAQRMPQALAKHKHNHFHFLFAGDESRMFYAHNHRTMWVASWDNADETE
jgi:hypothetical protein